uniref:MATH domain-containing protein n=1 Tax=Panagrellus redivivus TaxID=6233 RepID=A0A7E4UPT8_PANRE
MFIVSKPALMSHFAGLTAMMKIDTACEAIASSTSALDYFEDELIDDIPSRFGSPYGSPSAQSYMSSASSSSNSSSSGLKRTVSSLQSGASCSHSNPSQSCIVEAKQVEIDVASLVPADFWLCISSPNGESSGKMRFEKYGRTQRFSPRADGCGHGHWKIEIYFKNSDNKTFSKVSESSQYLDGVGSLLFTISEDFSIKLASQEFLRLPSACHNCVSHKTVTKPSKTGGLMRSAKFW